MTHLNYPTFNQFDNMFKGADKYLVGYDRLFDQLSRVHDQVTKNVPNYPPYNIRKTDENTYVIEMAVAGFGESDIEITLEDDRLTVSGSVDRTDAEYDVLHQGLALRDFTRTFTLDDQIEIDNAEMVNGLLKIWLERIIPESKKPKKIEINNSSDKKYLTE
jgi:molecular chaperone IbpA